jgi:hypothetical protein
MYGASVKNVIDFCSHYFSVVLLTERAETVLDSGSCCVMIKVCVVVCEAVYAGV